MEAYDCWAGQMITVRIASVARHGWLQRRSQWDWVRKEEAAGGDGC